MCFCPASSAWGCVVVNLGCIIMQDEVSPGATTGQPDTTLNRHSFVTNAETIEYVSHMIYVGGFT